MNSGKGSKTEYTMRAAKKILTMTARSAGIAIVSAILLILLAGRISSTSGEIMKSRGDLTAFTKKYELFDQMKKERASVESAVPKLESALPSLDTLPVIADYFNTLGPRTNNILTTGFSQGIKVNELSLAEIAFTMRASGTPQSIASLLAIMEDSPYFIKINNIALSSDDNMRRADLSAAGVVYLKND